MHVGPRPRVCREGTDYRMRAPRPGSQRQSGAGRSPPTAGVLLATPRMCLCVGGVVRCPPWACPPTGRAPTPGTCVSPYDPQVPEQTAPAAASALLAHVGFLQ